MTVETIAPRLHLTRAELMQRGVLAYLQREMQAKCAD